MAITELSGSRLRAGFADPDHLLEAVRRLQAEGHRVLDTYTPFPVHGMDEALGQRPSRLPRACLAFAVLGLAGALALQIWTSVFDYPVRVGGKPHLSLPAFIPVTFELTVLLAGLGVVASFFLVARLRPRLRVPDLHPGTSDHRFVLVAEVKAGSSVAEATALAAELGAVETAQLVQDRFAGHASILDREAPAWALPLAFAPALLVLLAIPFLNRDYRGRNVAWDGGMMRPLSAQAFDPSSVLKGGQVLQTPPEGTVHRQTPPLLGFGPGPAEAERAGRELRNPFPPTPEAFARGRVVFERTCAACHGRDGDNASSVVVARGAFAPSLLVSPPVKAMADGQLFHIATFGGPRKMKGFGDVLSREDRWKVVLYVRELQKAASTPTPGAHP